MLDVFLNCARAAAENRSNLAIAFPGRNPFDDFELAFGEGARPFEISGLSLFYFGSRPFREGMARSILAERSRFVHTHNCVCGSLLTFRISR